MSCELLLREEASLQELHIQRRTGHKCLTTFLFNYGTRVCIAEMLKRMFRILRRAYTLPAGYTCYPLHKDTNITDKMARVIDSTYKPPRLPRSSIFDYLFDGKGENYPTPNPNNTAFIDGFTGQRYTRGDAGLQARQLAGGLLSLGVKRGDVMCVFGMNSYEWVNALLGGQAAGLVVSPASYA